VAHLCPVRFPGVTATHLEGFGKSGDDSAGVEGRHRVESARHALPLRSHDGMGEGERTPTGSAVVRVEEAPW
jgi:hypothetical protein